MDLHVSLAYRIQYRNYSDEGKLIKRKMSMVIRIPLVLNFR